MTELHLLIDLHLRNDRQGPGADEETRRAIDLARLDPDAPYEIADIGCGTGASTLVLARTLRNARITAVDAAPPFIERLRARADQQGFIDRITAHVAHMESLSFDAERFDVIWSEGAIYNMGFEAGVRAWRRFLRPHGVLAVSEITWTTAVRPREIEDHWTSEYPGISAASERMRILEQAGYAPLACFLLPRRCWDENYYAPLQAAFPAFLDRHARSEDAQRIVAAEESELRLFQQHADWYSYAFYIARRHDDHPA
jgi:ubiquinone/menaquinone biosynthesis C-methylase UbiE